VGAIRNTLRAWYHELETPKPLRAASRVDKSGLPAFDPGPERTIAEGIDWLCRAQDHSASRDGGVARHFSLVDGWSYSYP
jgi:hypothetical protein